MPRHKKHKARTVTPEMIRDRYALIKSCGEPRPGYAVERTAFVFRLDGATEADVRASIKGEA